MNNILLPKIENQLCENGIQLEHMEKYSKSM